eukprot:5193862-Lingulodinium_polyedra.AAC.1
MPKNPRTAQFLEPSTSQVFKGKASATSPHGARWSKPLKTTSSSSAARRTTQTSTQILRTGSQQHCRAQQ